MFLLNPWYLPYQNPQQMVRWSDVMARICPQFHPRPPASPCPWEFTVFSVTFWGWIPSRFPCFFPWKLLFSVYSHIFTIYSHILPINFHNIFPWMGPSHLVFFFESRYSSASQGRAAPWQIVLKFVDEMKAWNPNKGPRLFWLEVELPCFRGFQESPGGSRSLLGVPGVSWGFQISPEV